MALAKTKSYRTLLKSDRLDKALIPSMLDEGEAHFLNVR